VISKRVFDDDHEAFRDSVKRFIATEVAPNLQKWRRDDGLPRNVVVAAGQSGFLGTAVPEEFGGGGTEDMRFLAVLIEETINAGATGLALLWALHVGVTIPCLLAHGSEPARQRWLPGLVGGELIGVPTPAASFTAHDDSLTGTVRGLCCGQLADLLLSDGDDVTLVSLRQPTVRVEPVTGNLAAPDAGVADVILDDVDVDADSVLSDGAASALRRDLDLWFAVLALAGARAALGLTVEYVKSRKIFGRTLASFENTRFRLAELSAESAIATAFVDSCILARNSGSLDAADAAAARLYTGALHDRAVDEGLQLHGGYGYMREYPISQAFADARFLRLAGQAYSDARQVVAEVLTLSPQ
jgi:alkylation response protein AidB-like acyl-CoA dehydrogenase